MHIRSIGLFLMMFYLFLAQAAVAGVVGTAQKVSGVVEVRKGSLARVNLEKPLSLEGVLAWLLPPEVLVGLPTVQA